MSYGSCDISWGDIDKLFIKEDKIKKGSEVMYKHFFKRCISIFGAVLALIVVGWLIIIVAIILHFANKGAGVFFMQERPGKDAKIYKVIKFKTMTDERDAEGKLLPDAQRLTKVGKIVRSLSIDELPQLINILKGDMSFIGPRPWKVEYLPLYSPEQMRRHEVRPGISGWAQVNGRNAISFTKRLEYDIYYVDHLTFWLDVKIFFMTIFKVFKREGISEEGQATSEAFNGHN
jgi:lipopolysaccharide/colanic/teichoic acid biosynthesis glycosyltransferase